MWGCGDAVHYLVDQTFGGHYCYSVIQLSLYVTKEGWSQCIHNTYRRYAKKFSSKSGHKGYIVARSKEMHHNGPTL